MIPRIVRIFETRALHVCRSLCFRCQHSGRRGGLRDRSRCLRGCRRGCLRRHSFRRCSYSRSRLRRRSFRNAGRLMRSSILPGIPIPSPFRTSIFIALRLIVLVIPVFPVASCILVHPVHALSGFQGFPTSLHLRKAIVLRSLCLFTRSRLIRSLCFLL